MEYALTNHSFDYVWQLNSDNVLSTDIWGAFAHYFEQGADFFGIEKLFIYEAATGRMKQYRYFDGCGIRAIRRDVIERAGWCVYARAKQRMRSMYVSITGGETGYFPEVKVNGRLFEQLSARRLFILWPDTAQRGLDNMSRNKMYWINGINTIKAPPPDRWPNELVVDIKSETNIWKYDDLSGDELTHAQKVKALRSFPEVEHLYSENRTKCH